MLGVDRIHVLGATGMTSEAAIVDLFGRAILKNENLGDVSTARDVR
jgi:hypothetical protein